VTPKPYLIHAEFVIEAESPDDAEEAVRSARFDDDLAPRWRCERTWWRGEIGDFADEDRADRARRSDPERVAAIAACPTPVYHETHRYCPSCPWTEDDGVPTS